MKAFSEKEFYSKALFIEFLRYAVVGFLSFCVDAGVLLLCYDVLLEQVPFQTLSGTVPLDLRTILSTGIAFLAGILVNYMLSSRFIFTNEEQKKVPKGKAFVLYILIGGIGLLLTELGMLLGAHLLGSHFDKWFLAVKTAVAAIVVVWNYAGRKIFVYKGA